MTDRGCPAGTEMDIESVDSLTLAKDVASTDITLKTTAVSIGAKRKIIDTEVYYAIRQATKSTQTLGHVFLGKRGEVVISTNYTLVKLTINTDTVQRLTEAARTGELDPITDIIMTSLARLEWNGERILEKAMTSFRLTLKNDLMPQLLKEVAELLSTEQEHHKVEQLAQNLLQQHLVKLFGMDVSSLIFILEHSSVDDAALTLTSTPRQEELQKMLLKFLPTWVWPWALWTVAPYQVKAEDGAPDFGFKNVAEVAFDTVPDQVEGSKSGTMPGPESPMPRTGEDVASSDALPGESRSVGDEDSSHNLNISGDMEDSEGRVTSTEEPKVPSQGGEELEIRRSSTEGISGGVGSKAAEEHEVLTSVSAEYQPGSKGLLRLEDVNTDDIPKLEVDLRLVIMGATDSGKSSTANSILGQELFPEGVSFSSVTTECQLGTTSRDGTTIEILDTPGLHDTTLTTQQVSSMVLKAVSRMEDGPDAVLYAIRIGVRYTQEKLDAYTLLKAILDDHITSYVIVVFTFGDRLGGQQIEDQLKRSPTVTTMLQECGNRYTVFDNTADNKSAQVNQLLTQIQQQKLQNRGRPYRCPRYSENLYDIDLDLEQRLVQADQERLKGKTYVQTLQARLLQTEHQLKKQREEFAWKERARQEASKRREEAARERILRLTEALEREQLEEEERRRQVEALRDKVAEEEKRACVETERAERRQATQWKRQYEETRHCLEELQADKKEAEREAARRQAEEMARLRMDIARSRRRRKNGCSVM